MPIAVPNKGFQTGQWSQAMVFGRASFPIKLARTPDTDRTATEFRIKLHFRLIAKASILPGRS